MPVEIKELVIRVVVEQGTVDPNEGGMAALNVAPASSPDTSVTNEIIQECVRQVLRILAKEKER